MQKIIVTGGCGFIGSNFINYVLDNKLAHNVINIDKMSYASNEEYINKKHRTDKKYSFYQDDLVKEPSLISTKGIEYIFHFAAESHVDNSIKNPKPFVDSNVVGTFNIVDWGYRHNIPVVVISTDEVYGSLSWKENSADEYYPLKPSSVYSSSKAAADLIALSYYKTHRYNVKITRCSNNFGYNQHKEKFIPNTILKALKKEKIPVYGNGMNIREWIWVEDHCKAVWEVATKGTPGNVYNIGSGNEQRNIDVVKMILDIMKLPHDLIEYVEDRKGHDIRYSIDCSKLQLETGWFPKVTEANFEEYLQKTIKFYSA
jgi:dTDP-glucose 4,6-dehydratase